MLNYRNIQYKNKNISKLPLQYFELSKKKKKIFAPTGNIGRLHQKPADFL